MAIHRLLPFALLPGLLAGGCGGDPVRFPAPSRVDPRFASLVPLRAVHLVGPDEVPWLAYDPSRIEDTTRALQRARALGARQVVIEAPYAFTTAPFDRAYDRVAAGNVVYSAATARPPLDYSFCQSGTFAPRPYRAPGAWLRRDLLVGAAAITGNDVINSGLAALPAHTSVTATLSVVALNGEPALDPVIQVLGVDEAGNTQGETLESADPRDPLSPRVGRVQFQSVQSVTVTGVGLARINVQLFGAVADDARAGDALRSVIGKAREEGLGVILSLRTHAVPASASECRTCKRDGECFAQDGPPSTCVFDAEGAISGVCRADPGSVSFLDPSADRKPGFGAFFAAYQAHVEGMARLAAETGVALLVLGGGAPYLSGGGASVFADNSLMDERRGELTAAWRKLATAARLAAGAVRPDPPLLLSYAAQSAFIEGNLRRQPPRPEWAMIDFWDVLDAVSIDLVLPGRPGLLETPDTTPREARELLQYMSTEGLATGQVYGNLAEIGAFAEARGYTPALRPVLLLGDRAPAMPGGAAQALAGTALPRPGTPVDFDEQARFVEARLLLVETAVQRGLIGGIALAAAPALVLVPVPAPGEPAPPDYAGQPGYGGRQKARQPPTDTRAGGFDLRSDYFGLVDTPAEDVLKKFWCPVGGNCLSSSR